MEHDNRRRVLYTCHTFEFILFSHGLQKMSATIPQTAQSDQPIWCCSLLKPNSVTFTLYSIARSSFSSSKLKSGPIFIQRIRLSVFINNSGPISQFCTQQVHHWKLITYFWHWVK